ncbi:MAG: hypothetical protein EOP04_06070, partial [Proteobacteria bacterium]
MSLALGSIITVLWVGTSPEASKAILKIFGLVYFSTFIYFGSRTYKIEKTLLASLFLIFILATMQFIEANFFAPSILFDVSTWRINLAPNIILGLGADLGMSYAGHLVSGITRISGSAGEPGHFQSLLVVVLPIFFFWKVEIFPRICIALGFLFLFMISLSKIGVVFLFGLAIYCTLRLFNAAWLSVLTWTLLYLAIAGYTFGVQAPLDLLTWNASIFERINGVRLYSALPVTEKMIGVGYRGVCSYLSSNVLKLTNTVRGEFIVSDEIGGCS